MTDELDEKDPELEEDFDPAKAKTAILLDDALVEDETNLDDFESDVPVEDEDGGFSQYSF